MMEVKRVGKVGGVVHATFDLVRKDFGGVLDARVHEIVVCL